jgi:hypothetical protein
MLVVDFDSPYIFFFIVKKLIFCRVVGCRDSMAGNVPWLRAVREFRERKLGKSTKEN